MLWKSSEWFVDNESAIKVKVRTAVISAGIILFFWFVFLRANPERGAPWCDDRKCPNVWTPSPDPRSPLKVKRIAGLNGLPQDAYPLPFKAAQEKDYERSWGVDEKHAYTYFVVETNNGRGSASWSIDWEGIGCFTRVPLIGQSQNCVQRGEVGGYPGKTLYVERSITHIPANYEIHPEQEECVKRGPWPLEIKVSLDDETIRNGQNGQLSADRIKYQGECPDHYVNPDRPLLWPEFLFEPEPRFRFLEGGVDYDPSLTYWACERVWDDETSSSLDACFSIHQGKLGPLQTPPYPHPALRRGIPKSFV